jgi:hypothetical protein
MKLLPMILEPYHYLLIHRKYEHPPRIKDGARKAVLIRDIYNPYTGELLGGYKKGTIGVVVPINEQRLQDMFFENKEWLLKGKSIYRKDCQRLDRTYDFFRYGTHYKTRKYELTHWHTYISRFDFEYINDNVEEKEKKETIQLSLFDNE